MSDKVRVRYAPSPTGYLHIGGARSALFNYLFAKKYNGDFIFRIEDTDIERNIEDCEKEQLDDLIWLGIIPDESIEKINPKYAPYRQTEKLDIYMAYAKKLVEMGYAYECYCSQEELDEMKEEQLANGIKSFKYDRRCLSLTKEEKEKYIKEGRKPSIRLKIMNNHELSFIDLVRGKVTFNSDDIGDFVIMKSNGIPTYNFAVVIDDHLMEITHVLRGEEHLSNTPKQLQIYEYFGWTPPKFGHMTIIINESGKKLSKRDNSIVQFVSQYKKLGYLPEAIFNFLCLLGYTDATGKEIFDKNYIFNTFDPSRLSTSPSMFDNKKLLWTNSQYIKNMSEDDYFNFIMPFIDGIGYLSDKTIEEKKKIALVFKNEINYGEEIKTHLEDILIKKDSLGEIEKEILIKDTSKIVLKLFYEKFNSTNDLSVLNIKNIFIEIKNITKYSGKEIYMPIRIALTGVTHGVEMYNIIEILGKEEVNKRLMASL